MLAAQPGSAFLGRACAQPRRVRQAARCGTRTTMAAKQTVLVTGAGGRTGRLIYEKLLQRADFDTRGLVRRAP
jgi:hypothetical protein